MNIANKLVTIAENEEKVYNAGYIVGYDVGCGEGEYVERKKMWGVFQNNGGGANYRYAFCYSRFTDETFNPTHDIVCTNVDSSAQYMFYQSPITDTKVAIYAPNTNITYAFRDSDIKIIRFLSVYETTEYTGAFTGCSNLEEIRFGGTIGQNISFAPCSKLSDASQDDIIEHLKDLTGSTSKTLTVHKTVYDKMVASGKDTLVTAKNWALAKG